MDYQFKALTTLQVWCQKVLPLVYDESLSYYELLCKVMDKLNDLIENNNKLPQYILDLITEYINGEEFQKIMSELLSKLFLNVKYPPEGIPPAVGDGSADDTASIQGCIDYSQQQGGLSIYIPSGVYLVQPLIVYNGTSLYGNDRYTTRLVMKGGATKNMVTGTATNITISDLTFDGNADIQVNNLDILDITIGSALIKNLILLDGHVLARLNVNDTLQFDNIIFKSAVVRSLELIGTGKVQGSNFIFENVSVLAGTNFATINTSNSILEQMDFRGAAPVEMSVNGSNNILRFWHGQSANSYQDQGANNTIESYNVSLKSQYSGSVNQTSAGYTLNATTMTENLSSDKVEGIKGNKTVNVTGNKTVNITGTVSKTARSETNTIADAFAINSSDIVLNCTNPLTYKTPTPGLNFDTIPFKDFNGNPYNVVVDNGNISDFKNVKAYGAKGDGVTDDTDAINKALLGGGVIYFPAGTYMIKCEDGSNRDGIAYLGAYGLIVRSNSTLILDEGAVLKTITNGSPTYVMLNLRNVNNVTITGGTLYGDRETHDYTTIPPGETVPGTHEWGFAIFAIGCENVLIENLRIKQFTGDGVYMGLFPNYTSTDTHVQCKNMKVDFVRISNVRRNGISVCSGSRFFINDIFFEDIVGTEPQCCIDIEAEGYWDAVTVDSVFISNCAESNCKNFIRKNKGTNIRVERCQSPYAEICYNESLNSNSCFISDCYFSSGLTSCQSSQSILSNCVINRLNVGEQTNHLLTNCFILTASHYGNNSTASFSNCRFYGDTFNTYSGGTLNYTFNECFFNITGQGINFKKGKQLFNNCRFTVGNIAFYGTGEAVFRNCEFTGCGGEFVIQMIDNIRLIVQNCGFYDFANTMTAVVHSRSSNNLFTGNFIRTTNKATYGFQVNNVSSYWTANGNYALDALTDSIINSNGKYRISGFNLSNAPNDGYITTVNGADVATTERKFYSTTGVN